MSETRSGALFLLLFVLGIVVVVGAGGLGGPEPTVKQYTAYEVTYEDEELALTAVDTGEDRQPGSATVDSDIVCLPSGTRECNLAAQQYEGDINATGAWSTFRYAYLDDEFYHIDANDDFAFEFDRTPASDAFDALATDSDRLTDLGRTVLEDGQARSTQPIGYTDHLVEHDGQYYTISQTATSVPGDSGSLCSSGGDDFCDQADAERRGDWVITAGSWVLGLLGIGVGGLGLLRRVWSWRTGTDDPGV